MEKYLFFSLTKFHYYKWHNGKFSKSTGTIPLSLRMFWHKLELLSQMWKMCILQSPIISKKWKLSKSKGSIYFHQFQGCEIISWNLVTPVDRRTTAIHNTSHIKTIYSWWIIYDVIVSDPCLSLIQCLFWFIYLSCFSL